MKTWPWHIAAHCEYFNVLRSKPALGQELEEVTYGDPIPGRPGLVRCYTIGTCLSGEILAEWGDGTQTFISGFQRGPNLGEDDLTVIPEGRVYYKALSDDVDFICIKPLDGGKLEQHQYNQPTHIPPRYNSWIVVLRGECTIEGKTLGQLEAVKHPGGHLEVNCTPDAVYLHVWQRGL